eukprot:10888021-Alexandrium_andersonii.AAC.1
MLRAWIKWRTHFRIHMGATPARSPADPQNTGICMTVAACRPAWPLPRVQSDRAPPGVAQRHARLRILQRAHALCIMRSALRWTWGPHGCMP